MENSPFSNTFPSSCPAENAVNVGAYRPQKYPLMLRPPHLRPLGVSSLLPSLSQARLGNLRRLCRSHTEQEPRAEPKPHATPTPPHSQVFWSMPQNAPLLPAQLCVQGHESHRAQLREAPGRNSSSLPTHVIPCHQPSLTPTHTWASPALLQPQVPPGGERPGLVASVCLPLSSLCQLN